MKPKEARHDGELYRLYQKVAREIERSGGKARRVILDLELKKDVYKPCLGYGQTKTKHMSESPSPAASI
ncbi:MAG: hypothetical protein ACRD8A_12460 [Candidatus Acidiferrales bacterium]